MSRRTRAKPTLRAALEVRGVAVAYDGRPVLRGITAVAEPGRLLAVTGPSGVGKTTLLWVMAGLLRPAEGAVTFDGVVLRDRDAALGAGVVLIPQDNGLVATLTAAENVRIPLLARGLAADRAAARTADALDRLDLTGQARQLVEELSGGQQQRTAIARGLAQRGAVLLADEVTSELDAGHRRRVLELLRAEATRGAAVVFATHDPDVAEVCDGELRLADGRTGADSGWEWPPP